MRYYHTSRIVRWIEKAIQTPVNAVIHCRTYDVIVLKRDFSPVGTHVRSAVARMWGYVGYVYRQFY